MKKKENLKHLAAVTLATAMLGTATCCYVRASLGSDAVAVFNDGFSRFFGVSLGTASIVYSVTLLVIAFLTAREKIAWTTVFNCLFTGVFIDLSNWALDPVLGFSSAIWFRALLFVAGLLLVAVSCALMIRHCPGMSVQDAVAGRLSERLGWAFGIVRLCLDGVTMLTGWILGGVVGVGSVAAVICTGPLIQRFAGLAKKT